MRGAGAGRTLYLLALAGLPVLLALLLRPGSYVGHPQSELPVKLWALETFAREGIFGGQVEVVSYPRTGPLNNPDPLGTLVTLPLRPLLGRAGAYDALVLIQLALVALAGRALGRELTGDEDAALLAGVGLASAPMLLAYGVDSTITDVLELWPYPLAWLHALRALRTGRLGNALAAGSLAGLGFLACPYDFLVFGAAGLAFAPLLLLSGGRLRFHGAPGAAPLRRLPALLLALGLGLGATAGAYAGWMHHLMHAEGAQVSASAVERTRHEYPYPALRPHQDSRLQSFLLDYLEPGKERLATRDRGSHYEQTAYAGWTLLALSLLGLLALPARRALLPWLGTALFLALASAGPYLPLDGEHALRSPSNWAWLLLHRYVPGMHLLLEPFRYALGVSFALAAAASGGALALRRLLGSRLGPWALRLLPALLVAEVALLSPVPFPLHAAELPVPGLYAELDRLLPPGALIELPYTLRGGPLYNREHFLHQLVHRRPIPNAIMGFLPDYFRDNPFTQVALQLERPEEGGPLGPDGRLALTYGRLQQALVALRRDGFAGLVVDPGRYRDRASWERARRWFQLLGPPLERDGLLLYRIPLQPALPELPELGPPPGGSAPAEGSPAQGDAALP